MGLNFLGTRILIGALPRLRGVADWYGFFYFFGFGLVVRMGAERRFASLLRIAAPSVERNSYIKSQTH